MHDNDSKVYLQEQNPGNELYKIFTNKLIRKTIYEVQFRLNFYSKFLKIHTRTKHFVNATETILFLIYYFSILISKIIIHWYRFQLSGFPLKVKMTML